MFIYYIKNINIQDIFGMCNCFFFSYFYCVYYFFNFSLFMLFLHIFIIVKSLKNKIRIKNNYTDKIYIIILKTF